MSARQATRFCMEAAAVSWRSRFRGESQPETVRTTQGGAEFLILSLGGMVDAEP